MAEKPHIDGQDAPQVVVLLHGIARTPRSMAPAAAYLGKLGYEILNIDYPSRSHSIRELATDLSVRLNKRSIEQFSAVHFLTHSMGGIVARAYLQRYRPANLGRVVMLAPPNQGSEVADLLSKNFFFNLFYGPAGQDLQTADKGMLAELGPVDFPLGVIAGTKSIDPISSRMISGPNDGKVSVENTRVDGMADHLVLPVNHTFLMRDADVLRQAAAFFGNGQFERNS